MEDIKKPDSFIFYRSFLESIEEADEKSQLELYRAIALYALNREEPQLRGMVKAVWMVIKPQIDANIKRYINGCKGAPHGNKGGAPKGNSNAKKQPQNNPKTTPNYNYNENENLNLNENECVMHTPTPEMIKDFIDQNNLDVDAEKFFNYYQSNGWANVYDWEARLKYWHSCGLRRRNSDVDKFSARRGTEPGAKSRKDFKGTF